MTSQVLIRTIRLRLWSKNQNFIALIHGPTGYGKSLAAIATAMSVDKNFTIDNVVFTPEQFLRRLKEAKKGTVLVFDEAGVGFSARNWQSELNKALSEVFNIFRFKNVAVLCTVPDASFVDVHLRKLFHAELRMMFINRKKKISVATWRCIMPNQNFGKNPLRPYPRRKQNGAVFKVKHVFFRLPPKSVINAYEEKKQAYGNKIIDDSISKASKADWQKVARDMYAQGLSVRKIAEKVGMGRSRVHEVVRPSSEFG